MTDNRDHSPITMISNETAYGGFLSIRKISYSFRKFDGYESAVVTREICERGNSAAILPYDPWRDEVALIRQVLPGNILAGLPNNALQIIAGRVEPGEDYIDVVCREAIEEANIDIKRLRQAQVFMPSPGGSSEVISTFVGLADLSKAGGVHGLASEQEDIRVEVMPSMKAIRMLDQGHITAGPAVVALSWFARNHHSLHSEWVALHGI